MKHNFFKSLIILSSAVYLLSGTGCRKLEDFGVTNIDPNGSSEPVTGALLVSAQSGIGGVVSGTGTGGTKAGLFAQYISETQYTDASLYAEPKLDMAGTYTGPLMDLQVIINKNTDPATSSSNLVLNSGSNANQIAVATIMQCYYFWTLTDRWGDIPYSEALKGTGVLTPSYDRQEDIYASLLDKLEAAVNGFDNGLAVQSDMMYGGDATKWKKLANTLRMMIALRMSKVHPNVGGVAATEFAAAFSDPNGYITSNADNFVLEADAGNYKNPYFVIYDSRTDYAFSQTLSDIMNNMNDSRLGAFSDPGPSFPYGLERVDAVAFTNSNPNYAKFLEASYRAAGAPTVIVNAAASLLTAAEGLERGWVPGGTAAAEAAYNQGVAESFAQWNAGSAAAYLAGAANYTTGTGGGSGIGANAYGSVVGADAITTTALERIALQRYMAHYPDGVQGWSEWRRTGVPNLTPTTFATNSAEGKQIPIRYVYAVTDYSLNPSKVAEAASRLDNGDKMHSHIWWNP